MDDLVQAVRERRTILFVGAGVSQNLGLPSFSGLVDYLAHELGFDPAIFQTQGDYLALCEYYRLEKGSIGPLRSWMDRTWHEGVNVRDSEVHRLIVELDFPVIYTTNYDAWLERAHEAHGAGYVKVTNVGDLARAKPDVTEIVKFHGDFEEDDSIVLTESQYFERLDFESPLDIKLRADLLGRSALFIGYSLTDINIRYMLYKLNRQWESAGLGGKMPKSFVFLTKPNSVQERVLSSRGVQPVVAEKDNPGDALRDFLKSLLAGKTQSP